MITNGWVTWAKKIPGVPDKVYSEPNSGIGFACHSVVGQESEFQDGVPNRFLSTEKDANGRYTLAAAASVIFILRKSGELIQMYPITASTWTSGGREANTNYIAMELEGGGYNPDGSKNFREPMTDAQVESFVRLIRELEAHKGIKYIPNVNMLQHKQLAEKFNYDATECASDRYDRAYARLLGNEEDMTRNEVLTLIREVIQQEVPQIVREVVTTEAIEEDTRYREVGAARNKLYHLASDVDATRVTNAVKTLTEAGFKL